MVSEKDIHIYLDFFLISYSYYYYYYYSYYYFDPLLLLLIPVLCMDSQ